MTTEEILEKLKSLGSEHHRNQLGRFGITTIEAYGVTSPNLQKLAKAIGTDHLQAIALFKSQVHEAKLIAAFLADPKSLTKEVMDDWAHQVYSWDLCDNLCMHLFRRSPLAREMALKWIKEEPEFVRRCGLVVMTSLSIHDKKATNELLLQFTNAALPYAADERNFVKKAISWLLRQQGKRNLELRENILEKCKEIESLFPDSRAAHWIVKDVTRELMKPAILARLEKKALGK